MNKQDYDKYYQQGGSYVIPVEVFNELFEDYECFKNDCKKYKEVIDKVKEYIEQNSDIYLNIMENKIGFFNKHDDGYVPIELLDILKEVDKEVE